ncbi:MAG: hypothetical protein QM765_40040 [Myxococcales bacterium]
MLDRHQLAAGVSGAEQGVRVDQARCRVIGVGEDGAEKLGPVAHAG